jgi:hypothetical protein
MFHGYFMMFSLIGIALGFVGFGYLKPARRADVPAFVWWLCIALAFVAFAIGISQCTVPSFAPRITAVGNAYDCLQIRQGRDSYFEFRFVPEQGSTVEMQTAIALPNWRRPDIFDGRSLRVVYLDKVKRPLKNEAIDIEILSGAHAGFHDSVDARPAGKWLVIPLGGALLTFGIFGIKARKVDVPAASRATALSN